MTLQGYQFDKAKVTPESDAKLYSYLAQSSDNKVISGMTATTTGLNVYVASGKALVQGRLVEVTQRHQLTAQANKSGYVCITVNLTQNNTSTGTPGTSDYLPVNNQLRIELVEVLNQQDLNSGGGLIYTFPLYSYVSTGSSVSITRVSKSFPILEKTGQAYLNYKLSVSFVRRGNLVQVIFPRQTNAILATSENAKQKETVPKGFRPSVDKHEFQINRNNLTNIGAPVLYAFGSDGSVYCTNSTDATSVFSGSTMYFTNDEMPE